MSKKINLHPLIKQPLILFVLVIVCSIVIIVLSGSYMDTAYDGREAEKRAMRIWKNKIDGSRQSNRIIDEYEKRYLELVKNNVVGDENRLNWFETIQAAANSRGMSSVRYNVSSQKLIEDTTGQHNAQGLKIYSSDMTLDIKMQHEGDLFFMLNTLQTKAKGLFVVDKCNIDKSQQSSRNKIETMQAHCELVWYTFKSAETGEKS